jgi:hypothetical protein
MLAVNGFKVNCSSTMKYPTAIFLVLTVLSCRQSTTELIDNLEKQKLEIENQLKNEKADLTTLVKIYGQTDLRKVIGKNWPDDIETTYNILKNQKGKIILIAEFPTSPSGDWILGFEHYFSDNGNLIAFEKRFSYFSGGCGEGMVNVNEIELYDNEFKIINATKTLRDQNDKDLNETQCGNPNDQDSPKRQTVKELMKLLKIRL